MKSMGGERLTRVTMSAAGLHGDRVVQVYDRSSRLVTARRYPRLLRLHATLGPDNEPCVDGWPWHSREATELVEAAVAPGARLERREGPERFDILPLLICTDGAVLRFGRDVRRLRPNLVIEGVTETAERQWAGATLRLPHADIKLADLRGRCVMTTYDPDTAEQDPGVLRDIVRRFGGRLCLNAQVLRPGSVAESESVTLLALRQSVTQAIDAR